MVACCVHTVYLSVLFCPIRADIQNKNKQLTVDSPLVLSPWATCVSRADNCPKWASGSVRDVYSPVVLLVYWAVRHTQMYTRRCKGGLRLLTVIVLQNRIRPRSVSPCCWTRIQNAAGFSFHCEILLQSIAASYSSLLLVDMADMSEYMYDWYHCSSVFPPTRAPPLT